MERKQLTLKEKFMNYRNGGSTKSTPSNSAPKKKKEVPIPEIIYPGELDIQEELGNMSGYGK